ncbi:hypothetical protein L3C95_14625 [Chitinophaga filiformis]|uniref:hypothetical protein n=1 Tax=Chitinophaga filiformis TaxID=104663 RepID=UPI001F22FCBE|nr:hypothetical protein [Chitinophaga filiformis]MCF6404126.1 hypothetical protein [Chitinophaga filiformis]
MKHTTFKQPLITLLAFVVLCIAMFGFATERGLDTYEIYLNNKLILKQAVNSPLNLRKLQLSDANSNDRLRIFYIHCTNDGVGTGRSISVEDEKGNVLKKWAFKDGEKGMEIPVKELLQVEKKNTDRVLSLHYVAQELHEGDMMLASVRFE